MEYFHWLISFLIMQKGMMPRILAPFVAPFFRFTGISPVLAFQTQKAQSLVFCKLYPFLVSKILKILALYEIMLTLLAIQALVYWLRLNILRLFFHSIEYSRFSFLSNRPPFSRVNSVAPVYSTINRILYFSFVSNKFH